MLQTEYSYKTLGFRKAHPAGDHWIDWYDGRDATEVMEKFAYRCGKVILGAKHNVPRAIDTCGLCRMA